MRSHWHWAHWRCDGAGRGATLLELMVAISLVAMAATGFFGVARVTVRSVQLTEGRLEAQQAARRGLERVIEELRWAAHVIGDPGCAPSGLCPDRVTVRIPAGNPYRLDQPYDVMFQYNPRQRELERRVGRGVNNLASAVEGIELIYLDAGSDPATVPERVVSIRIGLVVRPRGGPEATLASEVALRNRRVSTPPTPTSTPVWRPSPRGIGDPIPADRFTPPRVPPGRAQPR